MQYLCNECWYQGGFFPFLRRLNPAKQVLPNIFCYDVQCSIWLLHQPVQIWMLVIGMSRVFFLLSHQFEFKMFLLSIFPEKLMQVDAGPTQILVKISDYLVTLRSFWDIVRLMCHTHKKITLCIEWKQFITFGRMNKLM